MVQTFKKSLRRNPDAPQLALDRFLFNYRVTPHSTTGVTPAELMFGRKLRTRLDLLRPECGTAPVSEAVAEVAAKVEAKQTAMKKNYTKRPRKLELQLNSRVMIRNYGKFGAKSFPATVVKQTGPVSYKCQLEDGRVFRRHQDQVKVRGESPARQSEPLTPDEEDFLILSTTPSDTQLVPVPTDTPTVSPETPPASAVPATPSAINVKIPGVHIWNLGPKHDSHHALYFITESVSS